MTLKIVPSGGESPADIVEKVIALHKGDREVIVSGREFVVLQDVFDPTIAPSGRVGMCFSSSTDLRGKVIVDLGAGAGVFSCLFAYAGAKKVIATDVMPAPVRNVELNVNAHGLGHIVEVRQGNALAPINPFDGVDIVYCDFPFTDWRAPETPLDRAFFDPDLSGLCEVVSTFATESWYAEVDLYICVSSLTDLWERASSSLANLQRDRALVIESEWIDLELWRLRHRIRHR